MEVIVCDESNKDLWDDYVSNHPESNCYQQFDWKEVIEESFKHKCYYLMALSSGKVKGILPIVHMKSFMFGNFMVSLPYFNYGGMCVSDQNAKDALLEEAVNIASKEKVSHLELREQKYLECDMPVKTNKVCLYLSLPKNPDELWKSLKSKVRSQVRRPEREGETLFKTGGEELLEDFYHVFALNMRKLGTPVYPKLFFANILKRFPEKSKIHVLYLNGDAVSVGFTIGNKNILEIPWAASKAKYKKFGINMGFYWNVLKHACQSGYGVFDFGRSTMNGGTYHFKRQWGAKPVLLYWHYWLSKNKSKLPELNPANPKYRLAINIWRTFPLILTKSIGPHIVKNLP